MVCSKVSYELYNKSLIPCKLSKNMVVTQGDDAPRYNMVKKLAAEFKGVRDTGKIFR